MSYPIKETLTAYNRSRKLLVPQGITIHCTCDLGATDEREFLYFNGGNRNANAHYFADYDSISRFVPENERAWHAGPTANSKFIGIELCEFATKEQFMEVWNRGVWLAFDICKRYGFTKKNIYSHHEVTEMYKESDHTDPDAYFAKFGKDMDLFRAQVQAMLDADKGVPAPKTETKSAVDLPLPSGILKKGDKGEGVRQLQTALNYLKFNCGMADGDFGPATEKALEKFQLLNLPRNVDKVYGPQTKAKMQSLLSY